jgi:hypothetical protein
VRLQPSVKLKIDMLRTSIGSCLGARRRKGLRGILLKLFSRDLAFIVISYFCNATGPCGPSPRCSRGILECLFRGRNKSGNVTRWWLYFPPRDRDQLPRDILMNSASKTFGERAANFGISSAPVTAHQVFEQVIFEDLNV